MNIYDFDDTIYDGDSSVDFFKYCLKKNKKILLLIPSIGVSAILYVIKLKDKEYFKSKFFSFVKYFDDINKIAKDFWKENNKKIKSFYLENKEDDDIIISASPDFLLRPMCDALKVKLISSKFDEKTGVLLGKNCYGEEKVKRLEELGIKSCDKFYSDSKSDTPLKLIAKEAFLVERNNIKKW